MAERRENSVLISLRELRQIEDDRVSQEETDRAQREEAERRARMEAEQRARDEVERQKREAEDSERRRVEEEQRRIREDQLRLEEAERRARVEGQMKLEAERLHLEMQARVAAGPRFNPKILISVASVLVILIGGLGFFLYNQNQKQKALEAQNAELQDSIDQTLQRIAKNDSETQDLMAKLGQEHDEVKRKALEAEIAAKKAEAEREKQALAGLQGKKRSGGGGGAKKPTGPSTIQRKNNCDPNDPLCGL